MKVSIAATTLVLALVWSASAQAKTLVFCSEGNPEALNPQIVTTTTGLNAARPMFNHRQIAAATARAPRRAPIVHATHEKR